MRETSPTPPSPTRWARQVRRHEPHGPEALDDRVLDWAGRAEELARMSVAQYAAGLVPVLTLLAAIGGFAAVFGDPRDIAIGRVDAPDAADIPFASISFGVAAAGVIVVLIRWGLEERRRNGALLILLGLVLGFGVAGVLLAHQLAAAEGAEIAGVMIPTYLAVGLAAIGFVLVLVSPRRDPEPVVARTPVEELSDTARRHLVTERNRAIDILAERGLLPGVDVDALKARPLGGGPDDA